MLLRICPCTIRYSGTSPPLKNLHSQSTIRKIGESKRGQTLSASHRAAIAAGQKRRHATRRFLVAMDAMHQELSVTFDEPPEPPSVPLGDEEDASLFSSSSESVPSAAQQELTKAAVAAPESVPAIAAVAARSALPPVDSSSSMIDVYPDEQLDDVQREYRMRLKDFRRCASPGSCAELVISSQTQLQSCSHAHR